MEPQLVQLGGLWGMACFRPRLSELAGPPVTATRAGGRKAATTQANGPSDRVGARGIAFPFERPGHHGAFPGGVTQACAGFPNIAPQAKCDLAIC
jgi:hypothetical protein